METNSQHFIKIEIKGDERNLPEKDGCYLVAKKNNLKSSGLKPMIYTAISKKIWLKEIEYYFLPVPEPQQPEQPKSEKEIINGLGNIITGIQTDIDCKEKTNRNLLIDELTIIFDQVDAYFASQSHNNTVVGPSEEEIEKEAKKYDRSAYCSHTSGEDPSYHFTAGAKYALFQCKAIDLRATLRKYNNYLNSEAIEHITDYVSDTEIDKFIDYLKSPENK